MFDRKWWDGQEAMGAIMMAIQELPAAEQNEAQKEVLAFYKKLKKDKKSYEVFVVKNTISNTLVCTEQKIDNLNGHYARYKPSYHIGGLAFKDAIENLGGQVYNICVGKIGDVTIFNGLTWFSVCDVDSFEECNTWAKKLEDTLGVAK